MDSEEFQTCVSQMLELDRLVRSHVIYEAIALEGVIDNIISAHFCTDETKHIWFQSLIFRDGEVTFSKKIIILKKLLSNCYPEIDKLVPSLTKKLDDIRDLRNKFAHSALVLEKNKLAEAGDKGVFLRFIKDGQEKEELITKELADKVCKDNNYFTLLMVCIWLEIRNHASGSKDAGALLKLIRQLTEKFPEILDRVKPQPAVTAKQE
jgi:hypothetical protein